MGLNRRQFLIGSGALGGLSAVSWLHSLLPQKTVLAPAVADPSISLPIQPEPIAIAPKGLTAPGRGDVRIVVISDLNSQYGSTTYDPEVTQAIALIPDWQPDLVLCGGDMVAGQKTSLTDAQIQAMWQGFDQQIAAPLRRAKIPFGFTIGNHDGSGAIAQGKMRFQRDRDQASRYWNNPQHDPGLKFIDKAGFPFNYTFSQKGIFYLVWDASTDRIPENQLAWVEKSLASSTAQSAKMRIAIGHLPLYAVAVGRNTSGNVLSNPDPLRNLLEKYQVHTYISGHHHAYFPGKRGQLELLHTGALGGGPRQLLNSQLSPTKTLTVIDVNLNSESTLYTTYNMKDLSVIQTKSLPRIIVGVNGWVLRRDLTWEELPPQEQKI
ncbi:MAG: metallophosphoesterase [Snowella sp.]|nr:metallophosphoesterase [Snowella sp.]